MLKTTTYNRLFLFSALISSCSFLEAAPQCYILNDSAFGPYYCGTPSELQTLVLNYYNNGFWFPEVFSPVPLAVEPWDGKFLYVNIVSGDGIRTGGISEVGNCDGTSNSIGECSSQVILRKNKGATKSLSCEPSSFKGDPINASIGNEFEAEADYLVPGSPINLTRYYNSSDGQWSNTYSRRLSMVTGGALLINPDGSEVFFDLSGQAPIAESTELGKLIKSDSNWIYSSPNNEVMTFNSAGQLILDQSPTGNIQTLTYNGQTVTITDGYQHTLTLTVNAMLQPLSMVSGDLSILYTYDRASLLNVVKRTQGGSTTTRNYYYEDTRNPRALTGVVDERGIRYATWTYDAQGRAITSEHVGDVQKTVFTYNDDGTTTVTNELGKQATYKFTVINGVKHITSIQGEPSPHCSASNSTYTYDNRGQITQKTDAKGIVTQYTYNDRGLETQRVEGSGSAQPRTTTTEWDSSRFLRTKVAGPTHTTVYTYDAQGRQLTQVTTSNSSK